MFIVIVLKFWRLIFNIIVQVIVTVTYECTFKTGLLTVELFCYPSIINVQGSKIEIKKMFW